MGGWVRETVERDCEHRKGASVRGRALLRTKCQHGADGEPSIGLCKAYNDSSEGDTKATEPQDSEESLGAGQRHRHPKQ